VQKILKISRHGGYDGRFFLHKHYGKTVEKGGKMVGARIKEYLAEKGIKQSFLARETGLTDHAISDICNKDRRIDCMEYYKICKALDLPLEYFLPEEEEGE
jgi:DNA-binding Xre family transcriptional regulator